MVGSPKLLPLPSTLTWFSLLQGVSHTSTYKRILWNLSYCSLPTSDKKLICWRLTRDEVRYGYPQRALHGHGHFVSDVVLSSDGQFALSGSWDHTLRLWDLSTSVVIHLSLYRQKNNPFNSVIFVQWSDHQALCWTHQGCPQRCIFCWQQADRFWIKRWHH